MGVDFKPEVTRDHRDAPGPDIEHMGRRETQPGQSDGGLRLMFGFGYSGSGRWNLGMRSVRRTSRGPVCMLITATATSPLDMWRAQTWIHPGS